MSKCNTRLFAYCSYSRMLQIALGGAYNRDVSWLPSLANTTTIIPHHWCSWFWASNHMCSPHVKFRLHCYGVFASLHQTTIDPCPAREVSQTSAVWACHKHKVHRPSFLDVLLPAEYHPCLVSFGVPTFLLMGPSFALGLWCKPVLLVEKSMVWGFGGAQLLVPMLRPLDATAVGVSGLRL